MGEGGVFGVRAERFRAAAVAGGDATTTVAAGFRLRVARAEVRFAGDVVSEATIGIKGDVLATGDGGVGGVNIGAGATAAAIDSDIMCA